MLTRVEIGAREVSKAKYRVEGRALSIEIIEVSDG
jgi:hypothetical protein